MTLGLAGALWRDDQRAVFVVADSRISLGGGHHMDAGVKTYDLGGPCAVVAAGHALPPLMAADLTRTLVEGHNRKNPEARLTFFTTVKLFSFFAWRAAREQGARSRMAVVGFLEQGEPCIATVTVSPEFNRTNFKKLSPGDVTAIPVGDQAAAQLVLEAMARAKQEGGKVVQTAVGALFYLCKHEGAFRSVGGGLSVGTCLAPEIHFAWPIVEIDHSLFFRGMDVTSIRGTRAQPPESVDYDEGWFASIEVELASAPAPERPEATGTLPGYDIEKAISQENLFAPAAEPNLDLVRSDRDP
jgi:hypothetical protein